MISCCWCCWCSCGRGVELDERRVPRLYVGGGGETFETLKKAALVTDFPYLSMVVVVVKRVVVCFFINMAVRVGGWGVRRSNGN